MNIKLGAKVRQKIFKSEKETFKNLFLAADRISVADSLYLALQGIHNK
jgi:hypothetical protein